MIYSITYGNEKYNSAKSLNCKMAKKYGADKVISYGPEDIDEDFKRTNATIWNAPRGGGYWIWKPYILLKTIRMLGPEDYLIYSDAGSIFVNKIAYLTRAMEKEGCDLMVFSVAHLEKVYSKRDAFVLMDCDEPAYAETPQRLGTYIVCKNTPFVVSFLNEWQSYILDERIVTDNENVCGKENYEGFRGNRHDQTALSLLTKKYGIKAFRDPSQYGFEDGYAEAVGEDVLRRSSYPQVINSHRTPTAGSVFDAEVLWPGWYRVLRKKNDAVHFFLHHCKEKLKAHAKRR